MRPILILFAASLLHAAGTPREALLVLSKADHTLAIVDPATLKVVARAAVGDDPHEVVASADGKLAYVSNYGSGTLHTIAVIDLVAQKALAPIDLGPLRGPHGLVFVAGKLWFTAEGSKVIGSYDPATRKVDWIMGTGQDRTHMVWVSEDLRHIYTTNVSSATVTIMGKVKRQGPPGPPPGQGPGGPGGPPPPPRGEDWAETNVPVGRGAEGFDVSPDGKEIWAANAQDGTVSIIDAATMKVTETLPANYRGANRLKFTPDGKLALVSASGLAILDAATHKELKHLNISRGGAGIQLRPDGEIAYAACNQEGFVAVVDLKTMQVTGKIDAGPQPDGLAWAVRRE